MNQTIDGTYHFQTESIHIQDTLCLGFGVWLVNFGRGTSRKC